MATDADVFQVMAVDGDRADRALVERLYRLQVLARTFDEKAISLHRQGRLGTYAPVAGQEATQVGAASALAAEDWLFPTYRDHAMFLTREFAPVALLAYLRGRGNVIDYRPAGASDGFAGNGSAHASDGVADAGEGPADAGEGPADTNGGSADAGEGSPDERGPVGSPRTFPPTIPIATQLPHAVGVGMGAAYERRRERPEGDGSRGTAEDDRTAVLASFGDGATSEGDFHEALNVAGVFDAPVVFLCQNNRYAISTPVDRQTASATIAQKARAYGFDGVRVDGSDVLAVRRAVVDALDRARGGEGPTLVEAITYRRGAHTTTDDPSNYRDDGEADGHPDPVDVTREHLEAVHGWTDEEDAELRAWAEDRVAGAVATVEADDEPPVEDAFDHVYAGLPARLARQRTSAVERFDG